MDFLNTKNTNMNDKIGKISISFHVEKDGKKETILALSDYNCSFSLDSHNIKKLENLQNKLEEIKDTNWSEYHFLYEEDSKRIQNLFLKDYKKPSEDEILSSLNDFLQAKEAFLATSKISKLLVNEGDRKTGFIGKTYDKFFKNFEKTSGFTTKKKHYAMKMLSLIYNNNRPNKNFIPNVVSNFLFSSRKLNQYLEISKISQGLSPKQAGFAFDQIKNQNFKTFEDQKKFESQLKKSTEEAFNISPERTKALTSNLVDHYIRSKIEDKLGFEMNRYLSRRTNNSNNGIQSIQKPVPNTYGLASFGKDSGR